MDDRGAAWEKRLDPPLIVAAVATIPLLVLDQTHPHGTWHTVSRTCDWVIWLVFLVSLLIMLAVSPKRRLAYLRAHPLDLIVVVCTPPFLPVGVQWVRVLRVLRVVRVIRVAPIMRRTFSLEGIEYAFLLSLIALFGGAAAFSAADKVDYGDALYWALQTMTTVGYGDVVPHTALAKLIACALMIVGIGFFALVTGAIAQRFLVTEVEEAMHDIAAEDSALIAQIHALSEQLAELESRIRRREPGSLS